MPVNLFNVHWSNFLVSFMIYEVNWYYVINFDNSKLSFKTKQYYFYYWLFFPLYSSVSVMNVFTFPGNFTSQNNLQKTSDLVNYWMYWIKATFQACCIHWTLSWKGSCTAFWQCNSQDSGEIVVIQIEAYNLYWSSTQKRNEDSRFYCSVIVKK